MVPSRPSTLWLVMASWCPHCEPLSVEQGNNLARRLGVPLGILDVDDPEQERRADELVRAYGNWSEDYLVPQVFLEWSGGRVEHLLTGIPGPVAGTRRAWEELVRRLAPDAPAGT